MSEHVSDCQLLSGEWCLFILSNLGCKWISSCSWRQIYRPRLPGPQSELKGRKLPLQPHRTWLGDDLSRGSNLPPGESLPGSTWPFLPRVGGYREPGSVGCMPRNPVLALVLRVWASHFIRSGRESRPDCRGLVPRTPSVWPCLPPGSPGLSIWPPPALLPLLERPVLRREFFFYLLNPADLVWGVWRCLFLPVYPAAAFIFAIPCLVFVFKQILKSL